MTQPETDRQTADPIGRIMCFESGYEIGLLYRWDNGETQITLYSDWDIGPTEAELENTS